MSLEADRIRSKLGDITRSVARLRALHALGRETFLEDTDNQDIARSRLLTAIEAALNICYHTCAKRLHQVPEEYAQCFHLLGQAGLLPRDLAGRLALMARFRNRLVHLYWDIDYGQVYDFLPSALDDLEAYSAIVAGWLAGSRGAPGSDE